jgi:hypothetical protein
MSLFVAISAAAGKLIEGLAATASAYPPGRGVAPPVLRVMPARFYPLVAAATADIAPRLAPSLEAIYVAELSIFALFEIVYRAPTAFERAKVLLSFHRLTRKLNSRNPCT